MQETAMLLLNQIRYQMEQRRTLHLSSILCFEFQGIKLLIKEITQSSNGCLLFVQLNKQK